MKHFAPERALDILAGALARKAKETARRKYNYHVPSLWSGTGGRARDLAVSPYAYYLGVVRKLRRLTPPRRPKSTGGEWSRTAAIYNMFVRTTAAYDHNRSGNIELPVNSEGFRETGTFLKALAMLPYIKRLGADTIHLLPITSIGHDGNKGNLGSPYAIRNPYELDENLSEPSLGLDAKTEFKAFVEAAHNAGFRVVVEFVFRTAAKDGDWVKEHPEWFYWINDQVPLRQAQEMDETKYGSPFFNREELDRIHREVNEGRFDNLPPPHPQYRALFVPPPPAEQVQKEDGRYVGTLKDGRRAKIPGAFADWPPDDNQPPWGDVTYLRMYTNPEFDYIAYNTIRMYDGRLARHEFINRPLWDRIVGIVPYYQKEFAIDGVMIDMGHALPKELKQEMVRAARAVNPDFAFWDEIFAITQKSREEGYNAVFGYLWWDEHHLDRVKRFLGRLSSERLPIPFFASPESHNTPRAAARPGGTLYSQWTLVINSFMPGIPFLHSGYELGERYPINTGLDFTHEELKKLPSEKLPLFSAYAYDWLSKDEFSALVARVLALRKKYRALVLDPDPATFRLLHDPDHYIVAYTRAAEGAQKRLAVIGNADFNSPHRTSLHLATQKKVLVDLLSGKRFRAKDGVLEVALGPGQCLVVEY